MLKTEFTVDEMIAWLRTFGHLHASTIKLIERQQKRIEQLEQTPTHPLDAISTGVWKLLTGGK